MRQRLQGGDDDTKYGTSHLSAVQEKAQELYCTVRACRAKFEVEIYSGNVELFLAVRRQLYRAVVPSVLRQWIVAIVLYCTQSQLCRVSFSVTSAPLIEPVVTEYKEKI